MSEEIINPQTALDNLIDAAHAPEGDEEVPDTPAEEQAEDIEDSAEEPQESQDQDEEPEEVDKMFLNDFAKDVEVEMEDVYQLSVKMPNEEDMTITELKNFRIDNADIIQIKQDIQNREVELQAQSEAMRDVPQVSNELMQARAKVLSIQDQYNRTNWDAIRQENPAEWSALQQDFRNQFEGAKAQEAEASTQVDNQKTQARQFQQDRLFEAMPELKDDTVRQEAGARVQRFASKYGYSAQDVAGIDDSRLMRLLIDVSKAEGAVATVKEKLKKTPPKATKTAPRRMPSTRNASLKRLKTKAASSGSRQDIDAYFDAALR